jgi:hypothetical protein
MCDCRGFPWAGELYVGWFEETVTLCHSYAGLQSTRYVVYLLLLFSVAKSKRPQTFYMRVHTSIVGDVAVIWNSSLSMTYISASDISASRTPVGFFVIFICHFHNIFHCLCWWEYVFHLVSLHSWKQVETGRCLICTKRRI